MVATPTRPKAQLAGKPEIVWEKLPEDFVLPDDPVDNINQPALAAALTDSLFFAGYLSETSATTTNYGIGAKVDGKTVVKAPDWSWIPAISVPKTEIERGYTPVLEGDLPLVIMEFILEAEGTQEYSIRPIHPLGKWFYYERVLKVPNYVVFYHKTGTIEPYQLSEKGVYQPQVPDQDGLYWLAEANLFLGAWEGAHQNRSGWWLRWWDADKQMLLWGEELIKQERQKAEQVQQSAIAKLTELGLSAEQIADTLSLSVEDVQPQLEN
ncbi:Uma2 family endonuclease [Leptolyngbya sp. BC1307]|uniref:Uma2 family endonuclease n=1 Tax=Leptolyngbya sp. BC1307 TaxID=2029589 RepID=UPI000EFD9919|nr:Uma2 family endonuclease [Leptolyngbya sp. BC1307]